MLSVRRANVTAPTGSSGVVTAMRSSGPSAP